ncbi:MAG: aspartate kinase [Planctomycetes bacterium DG_23]|nr:MAG: aspartate kinase [Planctomycetes bacterium DG_23]
MGLIVQKFGGTSLADSSHIKRAAKRVAEVKRAGNQVIVVVSARGQTTDELYALAYEITDNPSSRELDMLVSTGEQVSACLLTMALHAMGEEASAFTAGQIGILTDSRHTKAKIMRIDPQRLGQELEQGSIPVVAGFQGVDEQDNITTLGRGGSDTTAVALAAVFKADICEIYTDVEGVYTSDPRIVAEARKLSVLSYDEMLELASSGASVLQHRAVEFAKKYNVPVMVRSSFSDFPGTIISEEVRTMEDVVVRGAAVEKNEAKITIRGVPDRPGIAARILGSVAEQDLNIDMIVQNISAEGLTDVTLTVARSDLKEAIEVFEKLKKEIGARGVESDEHIAKISVVGVGMRTHSGVATKMFQALAEAGINIQMISTSEIKISCVIDEKSADEALRVVHKAFELEKAATK